MYFKTKSKTRAAEPRLTPREQTCVGRALYYIQTLAEKRAAEFDADEWREVVSGLRILRALTDREEERFTLGVILDELGEVRQ
jgi:hypothetical protein